MSSQDKYKEALRKISSLIDGKPTHVDEAERYELVVDEWVGGNVDDAYYIGRERGWWDAKVIADAALAEVES